MAAHRLKKTASNPGKRNPKRVKEVAGDEPKPLQARSSLREASEKMRSLKTDKFPVASGDRLVGTVVGKYSDRKAAGFGHDPATTPVQGIMAKQKHYCFEDQSVDEARDLMRKHQLKHLPVVDKDLRVVGIVEWKDVAPGGNAASFLESGRSRADSPGQAPGGPEGESRRGSRSRSE